MRENPGCEDLPCYPDYFTRDARRDKSLKPREGEREGGQSAAAAARNRASAQKRALALMVTHASAETFSAAECYLCQ